MGDKNRFHRGQRLRAEVIEVLAGGELLLALNGRLVRVKNAMIFPRPRAGMILDLVVKSAQPLELRTLSEGHLSILG